MAEKSETDLVKLAFELLAERGWERFSFAELARRAGAAAGARSMPSCPIAPPCCACSAAGSTREMLAIDMAELDGMSPRERVFELIMRRLDAMAPYKRGPAHARRARPRREPTLLARRLLQSRPAQPAPARRGRDRRRPGHARGWRGG